MVRFNPYVSVTVVGNSKNLQKFLDDCESVENMLPYVCDISAYRPLPPKVALPFIRLVKELEAGKGVDTVAYFAEKGISDPATALSEIYSKVPSMKKYRELLREMENEDYLCAEDLCTALYGRCVKIDWEKDDSPVEAVFKGNTLEPSEEYKAAMQATKNKFGLGETNIKARFTNLLVKVSECYPQLVFWQDLQIDYSIDEEDKGIVYAHQGRIVHDEEGATAKKVPLPTAEDVMTRFGLIKTNS